MHLRRSRRTVPSHDKPPRLPKGFETDANKGWLTRFDEPIVLDDGTKLATLRAIHRNGDIIFNSDRKDHYCGKRKLKRDPR